MAVNRFSRPVNSRLISQFAPKDLNMIAKVLAAKQLRYDTETAKMEAVQDQHSQLTGIGPDQEILRQSGEALNDLATQYANKDLSDSRISKELRGKAKAIANDPVIRATQQTVQAVQQWREAKRDMEDYRIYNDPFIQQLQGYKGARDGALSFTGIQEGVDERATAEKFFDNIPDSAKKGYIQMGETFKQVGWEGVTNARVEQIAGSNIDSFANTQAGRQALNRYHYLRNSGGLPVDRNGEPVTAKSYLGSILLDAGRERVGVKTIGGQAQGGFSGGGGYSGFNSGGSSFPGPQMPTRVASTLSKLGLEFNDDGSVKGSGNSSWIEWLKGEKSFSEVWNDDSLTPQEKQDVEMLEVYSKALGVTPHDAYKKLDQTMAPNFTITSNADKKLLSDTMFKEGSGIANQMMAYDIHGNPIPGQEVMESEGLVDSDGQLVEDSGKYVNILGKHDPNTGLIPKGVHVDINGNYYIFEMSNPNGEEIARATKANFLATGIMKDPEDGHYRIRIPGTNEIGVWDPNQNKLVPLNEWQANKSR